MQLMWYDRAGKLQQQHLDKASKQAIAVAILRQAAALMATS